MQQPYVEVQNRKPIFVYGVVLLVIITTWYGFIRQILLEQQMGTNPAPNWVVWLITIIFGIGFPILMFSMRLTIEVLSDRVVVKYIPFVNREILCRNIQSVEARHYNPIAEYGGWGIRGFFGNKRAYNMSGNRGVELLTKDGERIMLGSQRADELAASIKARI